VLLLLCVLLEWWKLSPLPAPAITGLHYAPQAAPIPTLPDQRLYAAVQSNDLAEAEAALRDGADVNRRCGEWQYPLLVTAAGFRRNPDMIALLLKHHADPNQRDHSGSSPLHFVANDPDSNPVEVKKLGSKAAGKRAETIQYRMMRLLLEAGADPNARNQSDTTPLHVLANRNNDGAVGRLILLAKYHADLNALNTHRQSALHILANRGAPEMIRALLRLHANPNLRDDEERTPLMCVNSWDEATYRAMLEGGANVHLRDREGRTILLQLFEQAAQSHNHEFTDNEGEFHPEHAAPTDERVVRLLLRYGARVTVADRAGKTPLEWAKQLAAICVDKKNRRKAMVMVRLLEQAGAQTSRLPFQMQ
jgi:ankyrin repeat protein